MSLQLRTTAVLFTAWFLFGATTAIGREAEGISSTEKIDAREMAVEIQLLDLLAIEGQNQDFRADVGVLLQWHDPGLVDAGHREPRVMPAADVGWPGLQVVNDRDVDSKLPEVVEVSPDGTVIYRQRFLGEFSTVMDLRDFPLDSQRLAVRFAVPGKGPEEVVLSCAESSGEVTFDPTAADWRINRVTSQRADYSIRNMDRTLAGVELNIDVTRRIGYYVGMAFVSVAIIVLMSWAVFWLPAKHINPRVSISVTSMLTLIAYRFLLGQELPRIPYMTRLDYFLLGSTILVFLALVVVTLSAAAEGAGRAIGGIDRHSRWIFPLAYGALFVAVFLL